MQSLQKLTVGSIKQFKQQNPWKLKKSTIIPTSDHTGTVPMRRDSHYLVRLWQFNNVCDNFKKTEKSKVWIPTANVGTKQIKLTRKRPGNVQNFLINWSFSQTVKTKRLFPHYLLLENARKRKGNSFIKWESEFTYFCIESLGLFSKK